MRYRQSCSSCVGRSQTAMHDIERYERDLSIHRAAQRLALVRVARPPARHGGGNDGTPEAWQAEADHHGELASTAERRLNRARVRVAQAFSIGPCALCSGSGYILAPGTFVRGAKGFVE